MPYIVIIDDDIDFSHAVADALNTPDHEIQVVNDCDEAIRVMECRRPDLVILDVMFPGDDSAGFRLARAMRHHRHALNNIPILMLTAINHKLPLGFSKRDIDNNWLPITDFLEKPVVLNVLREKVKSLLDPTSG